MTQHGPNIRPLHIWLLQQTVIKQHHNQQKMPLGGEEGVGLLTYRQKTFMKTSICASMSPTKDFNMIFYYPNPIYNKRSTISTHKNANNLLVYIGKNYKLSDMTMNYIAFIVFK